MNRISAQVKIVFGLQMLLISAMALAVALGFVPSEQSATMKGRAAVAETIAVNASAFIAGEDIQALGAVLRAIAQRNPDILSIGVRETRGPLVIEIGDHQSQWKVSEADKSTDSQLFVPILSGNRTWGAVEIRFRPIGASGPLAFIHSPNFRLIGFVSLVSIVSFMIYLKRTLKHLDPSKVVPPHVRAALDTLAEGLLILDPDGRIALANRAFAQVVGKDADKLMGTRASLLKWEMEQPEANGVRPSLPWEKMEADAPRRNCTMHLTDAAGVRRTFIVNCCPVIGARGKARGALASFEDITPLVEKELELRKSKLAADEANRAKSEFLARMSHEIRTPMNAVLGFADVLRRGYEENESQRQDFLNTIHSSGQHLLELINDILDLSKIESGKLEIELTRCSVHQLITEVVAILGIRAQEKGLYLEFAWDGPAPQTILTDPTRFRQVITNVVGNALKFTETGGVRVVARIDTSIRSRPQLIADIIDTGIGMKAESLGKIFTPFTQADNSITRRFGGTGLGLSISKQCAVALGGNLSVRSEVGKGSVFTITIDAGPADQIVTVDPATLSRSAAATPARGSSSIQLKPSRVLVAEDGISNQKLISIVLRRAGIVPEFAVNGQIAVDKALAGTFDLILMDMQMPVMDGVTATRTLREAGIRGPIIALTANAMKGEEDKCRQAGCTGFLTKPIDVDLLLRTLAEVLGEADSATASAPVPTLPPIVPASIPLESAVSAALTSTLPLDDVEFVEIVEEFVDRMHQQLGKMQEALNDGEYTELASLAHWLKGSGGTAGFAAFTEPSANLEKLAKEKRTGELEAALAAVADVGRRVAKPVRPLSTAEAN